jgi:hypothetical protein
MEREGLLGCLSFLCWGLWAAAAAIAPLKERRASQNNPIEIHLSFNIMK